MSAIAFGAFRTLIAFLQVLLLSGASGSAAALYFLRAVMFRGIRKYIVIAFLLVPSLSRASGSALRLYVHKCHGALAPPEAHFDFIFMNTIALWSLQTQTLIAFL